MKRNSDDSPVVSIRRAAMDYLARREHSKHELVLKLSDKFPEDEYTDLIIPVIDRLTQQNLQSDHRFTESYVRYRRNKGFGPLKIEGELKSKGLALDLIRDELYHPDNDWQNLCAKALQKKYGQACVQYSTQKSKALTKVENNQSHERQLATKILLQQQRFLQQRGFLHEDIRALLKR